MSKDSISILLFSAPMNFWNILGFCVILFPFISIRSLKLTFFCEHCLHESFLILSLNSWIYLKFQLNFAVGIINLLYFLLRLQATEDFLVFMFEMETIGMTNKSSSYQMFKCLFNIFVFSVDMLTLPPLFMSVWIERTWIGLRFFRFLIWFNFPDIMVYLRVITNSSTIRLAQVHTQKRDWMKNMSPYFKSSSSPFQLLSYIIGGLMWFAGLLFLLGSDNTI